MSNEQVVGAEILDEDDREYLNIPIAVWGGKSARVQTLNAKELIDVIEHGGTNIGYKLIALCMVDTQGRQVFREKDAPLLEITDPEQNPAAAAAIDAAVARVKLKNPKAITQLSEALVKVNNITLKTANDGTPPVDDVKNDSGETATDVSPTS